MNRLQLLQQFYQDEPQDPFNVYVLALEYLKTDAQQAKILFEELLSQHPDYIATYYHAAALFAELGLNEKAEKTYQTGIDLAFQQQKTRTYDELKRAYRGFLDEQDL